MQECASHTKVKAHRKFVRRERMHLDGSRNTHTDTSVRSKILDLAILAFNDTRDDIRRMQHAMQSAYHANATIAVWDRKFD